MSNYPTYNSILVDILLLGCNRNTRCKFSHTDLSYLILLQCFDFRRTLVIKVYCIPIVSRKLVSKVQIGSTQIITIVVSGVLSGTQAISWVCIAVVICRIIVAKAISQVAITITIVVPWVIVTEVQTLVGIAVAVSIINVISWVCGTIAYIVSWVAVTVVKTGRTKTEVESWIVSTGVSPDKRLAERQKGIAKEY